MASQEYEKIDINETEAKGEREEAREQNLFKQFAWPLGSDRLIH
jgi:hypothetical protein